MISKYSHKELNWIDLELPKEEEIAYILEEYPIPLFIKDKIILKSEEDKMSLDYGFIYASLYFPKTTINKNIENKLVFIVNNDFVITIHDQPIETFRFLLKEMELDTFIEKLKINDNKFLFAHLLKNLYLTSRQELIISDNKIKNLHEQIIKKNRRLKLLTRLLFLLLGAIILISIYVFSHI